MRYQINNSAPVLVCFSAKVVFSKRKPRLDSDLRSKFSEMMSLYCLHAAPVRNGLFMSQRSVKVLQKWPSRAVDFSCMTGLDSHTPRPLKRNILHVRIFQWFSTSLLYILTERDAPSYDMAKFTSMVIHISRDICGQKTIPHVWYLAFGYVRFFAPRCGQMKTLKFLTTNPTCGFRYLIESGVRLSHNWWDWPGYTHYLHTHTGTVQTSASSPLTASPGLDTHISAGRDAISNCCSYRSLPNQINGYCRTDPSLSLLHNHQGITNPLERGMQP